MKSIFGVLPALVGKRKKNNPNSFTYLPAFCKENQSSPLQGKNILFLGSSVTCGARAKGNSFADYLAVTDGVKVTKEAVSGTTLATSRENNYIERLKKISTAEHFDAVVCQLSTNDASKGIPLGVLSEGAPYNTETVLGALQYITAYVKAHFHCPVIFYTGTKYESAAYEAMVEGLLRFARQEDITVIDLWHNAKMNAVSPTDYAFYMNDPRVTRQIRTTP